MIHDENGSMLPMLALIMIVSFTTLAIAVELSAWGAQWREVAFVADTGAAAGAVELDLAGLYGGVTRLDQASAEQTAVAAALAARPRSDRVATASAGSTSVCVDVRQVFEPRLLSFAGIGAQEVRAEACATLAQG